jgi:hypothetical protein
MVARATDRVSVGWLCCLLATVPPCRLLRHHLRSLAPVAFADLAVCGRRALVHVHRLPTAGEGFAVVFGSHAVAAGTSHNMAELAAAAEMT